MPRQSIPIKQLLSSTPQEFDAGNPLILSPEELATLLGLSIKTIYVWLEAGRLDGCVRKRGKHWLILRDAALDKIFNGPDWRNDREIKRKNQNRESSSDLPER